MMKDLGKFANVPVETDTTIRKNNLLEIESLQALHQQWFWEGIEAESLIFVADEVSQLDDDGLAKLVQAARLCRDSSPCTITRDRSGYTFVNFNFKVS